MLLTLASTAFLAWLGWSLFKDVQKQDSIPLRELARDGAVGLGILVTLYLVLKNVCP